MRDAQYPTAPPAYFILLDWTRDQLLTIRDFRFARCAMEGAEIVVIAQPRASNPMGSV